MSKNFQGFYNEKLDAKVVASKVEITTPHGAMEGKTQTREVRFCKRWHISKTRTPGCRSSLVSSL